MPTPVTTAKQSLNCDASHAIDKAVAVARRRCHSQTTSLHAVSAFLSLTPSLLKEACIRARNAAFYPKVQFKALEFCLNASLDRLPISQPRVDEPHVSNSLMAAIKRSQANQKRHPDSGMGVRHYQDQNFGVILSSQSSSSSSSLNGVKVNLQHLIVAILDDPIVSRVFSDAGFNSFDVKLAILRPFQGLFRYPGPGTCQYPFPISGYPDEEGEYRRICEVFRRKKGRNPLLVGACANVVLKGFVEILERKKEGVLGIDMFGMNVVSIENDVVKFLSYDHVNLRFKEVNLMVDQCLGHGLVINVGDVECFLGRDEGCHMDVVNYVVRKLIKLLEMHCGRVWVVGSAANDQIYMEFMSRFPRIDKDWDLQPLPISYVKPKMGESSFKSSLMGSFVPLGGFFSSLSDGKDPLSSTCQSLNGCTICSGNLEQDVTGVSRRGLMTSVTDYGVDSSLHCPKANRGSTLRSVTAASSQRDQVEMCHCHIQNQPSPKPDSFKPPTTVALYCSHQRAKTVNIEGSCTTSFLCTNCEYSNVNPCVPMDVQKQLTFQSSKPVPPGSLMNKHGLAKPPGSPSSIDHLHPGDYVSPNSLCFSGVDDGHSSPSSGVSVTTDIGLELFSQVGERQKKVDARADDGCYVAKCSNHASLKFDGQTGNSFKELFKALSQRVGRQSEALRVISLSVSESWANNYQRSSLRGDIWLNFSGPDVFGKRKTALALAETLYGSKKHFVHMNLCFEDVVSQCRKVFGYQITTDSDARSRGKTVIDLIAEGLRKTPFGVVYLENAQSANPLAQDSLLQAIRTGKFCDSYGREVTLANRVFVLAAVPATVRELSPSSRWKDFNFPERRIATARSFPLQLVVRGVRDCTFHHISSIYGPEKNFPKQNFVSKRKVNGLDGTVNQCVDVDLVKRPHRSLSMSLDLNLPAEMPEADDTDHNASDRGHKGEKFVPWLQESSDKVVAKTLVKVVFDPFDYDALAKRILELVQGSLYKVTTSKCLLEIEQRAMDEIIAAACSSENDREIEDWIDQVLSKAFAEAQVMHQLTDYSTVVLCTRDCEAMQEEDQTLGVRLPSKISVTKDT